MSELTKEECLKLGCAFAKEYNSQNKTAFLWTDTSYQAQEPHDFCLYDGQESLNVQAIRACGDIKRDVSREKKLMNFISKYLRPQIRHLFGVIIWIAFSDLPVTDKEKRKIAQCLYVLAASKAQKAKDGVVFSYREEDKPLLKRLSSYVLEFEVQRIVGAEEDQLEGTVMFPIKDLNTDSLPDQTKIIMEAVRKKQNKYDISSLSKMILLIHFDDFPFHSWFLPKHEKELVASNFRQVWIINNFDNNRQSVRIK